MSPMVKTYIVLYYDWLTPLCMRMYVYVSSQGAEALCDALRAEPRPSLQRLDLRSTSITPEGVASLGQVQSTVSVALLPVVVTFSRQVQHLHHPRGRGITRTGESTQT